MGEESFSSAFLVKSTSVRTLAYLESLGVREFLQPDLSQFDRVLLTPSSILGSQEGRLFIKDPEGWNSYLDVDAPQSVWFDCEEYTDPSDIRALYDSSYLQYEGSGRDYYAVFWLKEDHRGVTLLIPGDKLPEQYRPAMERLAEAQQESG